MAHTKPMLRYLLPGLSAAIALSLAATVLSNNTFLNWFNNSFNRTTIHHNNGEASNPGEKEPDASPSDPTETGSISVRIEPIITVEPAAVNVLPEIAVNVDPAITIDNGSEANSSTTANPQVEINWPEFEVEQEWWQRQGAATQAMVAAVMPGANAALGPLGVPPVSVFSSWDVSQQFNSVFNALSPPVAVNPSATEAMVQNVYHCPKISQMPIAVPEPRSVVGLGVMGLVLSGVISLGKGLR
ncbi:MAG: hypothetical protein HC812_01540 [Leptolyngbya sp. RL_3_1]|nr:hypothetical protein [Leptolyngbya sp. RL_3_1]